MVLLEVESTYIFYMVNRGFFMAVVTCNLHHLCKCIRSHSEVDFLCMILFYSLPSETNKLVTNYSVIPIKTTRKRNHQFSSSHHHRLHFMPESNVYGKNNASPISFPSVHKSSWGEKPFCYLIFNYSKIPLYTRARADNTLERERERERARVRIYMCIHVYPYSCALAARECERAIYTRKIEEQRRIARECIVRRVYGAYVHAPKG